jgi:DnaA-homolog protein
VQLPLALRWAPEFELSAFFFADKSLPAFFQDVLDSATHRAVLLVGPENSGKSYLLRALAASAGGEVMSARALSGRQRVTGTRLFGTDDLEHALGDAPSEEWLFHDYNRALDAGGLWLAAARNAPPHLPIQLPDLRSRLMQATLVRLPAITDQDTRHALLRQQAAGLGVDLEDGVLSYLETHVTRNLAQLSQWLKRLNEYSLSRGRKITAHGVRELMREDKTQ